MIYQNSPVLDGNERKYVLDCLDSNWIGSTGMYVNRFEEYFADYCGAKYGVACSSGTAALHLAMLALGIGPGDEVIIPCYTLIADANMVILAGAKPVFVDVDDRTWCIDAKIIESKITPNTKAILCVHMYGHPCNMDEIEVIAERHKLYIIEDAAQAHGTEYKGRRAGNLGDIACFSFYSSKLLTTGEGGMLLTNDDVVAQLLKKLRSQGFEGDGRNYVHRDFGFNYRLTNLQAAIGLAQAELLNEKITQKRNIAVTYTRLLNKQPGILLPIEEAWAKSTFWNYMILIDDTFGISRNDVIKKLSEKSIETRLPFRSLNSQPLFAHSSDIRYPDITGSYPIAEYISEKGLCLPSGLNLTEQDINEVVSSLLSCRA